MNPVEIEDVVRRLELMVGRGAFHAPCVEPTAFSILQEDSRKAVESELELKFAVDIARTVANVSG